MLFSVNFCEVYLIFNNPLKHFFLNFKIMWFHLNYLFSYIWCGSHQQMLTFVIWIEFYNTCYPFTPSQKWLYYSLAIYISGVSQRVPSSREPSPPMAFDLNYKQSLVTKLERKIHTKPPSLWHEIQVWKFPQTTLRLIIL